ncbi:tRNA synthetases class I (M)-domain-containing protein [Pisolithus orientalis]|uniref:tRNA synthetases class I (M)-domain-containing protein n=1 Tax=Pisolithus orientalis TaxID=936130 RepID=UPI0022253FA5|nr:tRNA synthetases class I (M)-domain-containing protein [Pisolithus orientalis]KAI6025868.1 tRNA synthetases class I (M)-domain-containing protein [Pisolithus orientalis]
MTRNVRENISRLIPDPGQSAVLPKDGETNILITSALPYCNNVPHLGNIIGSVLSADVFSRYNRARNRRTLYICGTDEYGTASETAALKEGVTPRELCDKYHAVHKETYEWFDIGFDLFGRTSTPYHTEICQSVYLNLGKNDYLEKQVKDQTYCDGCAKFLADRYVEGICPHCGFPDARGDQCDGCSRTLDAIDLIEPRCLLDKSHKVVTRSSSHMYFKLDTIQPRLEEWIKESYKEGKWSPNATINTEGEIVDARVKTGLRPTPVTRDLTWGVPIPPLGREDDKEMDGKVLYVWFDAVNGYASITANYTPEWRQWWHNPENVKLYQFMGKDNVYFHTIYFPGMLLADGGHWTMLHHVSTTEYLNYEGGKFSKSKNRGVFGPQAKETGIPASVWRYYLLATRPETQDAMFSWADCIAANNNVLLKNFGNFVNRALKFVSSQYNGIIPESSDEPGPLSPNDPLDSEFINEVNALLKEYVDALESVKIRLGLQIAMLVSNRGNGYLQAAGLNKMFLAENPQRCAQVVSRAVNLIYVLSALIYPYMPSTSEAILEQLNAPARVIPEVLSTDILGGHHIGKPDHLFKPIDEKMEAVWKGKFEGSGGVSQEAPAPKRKPKKATADNARVNGVKENGPKSEEALALEARILEHGQYVRSLKEKKEAKEVIDAAVVELKKLKTELAALEKA